jgi:hypothetical protein
MTYQLSNWRKHSKEAWAAFVFKLADLISPLGTDGKKHLFDVDLKLIDQLFFKTLVWSRHLHASVNTGLSTTSLDNTVRSKENI